VVFPVPGRPPKTMRIAGRLIMPHHPSDGAIAEADVLGDLCDLAGGARVRRSPSDVTFFQNAGGGQLDSMTFEAVFQQLGQKLA
jgi:ornithine cyclodeaminase/alanine dehydrogenase-like protein (mu-crystallin family)